jgi:hypothetical protein
VADGFLPEPCLGLYKVSDFRGTGAFSQLQANGLRAGQIKRLIIWPSCLEGFEVAIREFNEGNAFAIQEALASCVSVAQ